MRFISIRELKSTPGRIWSSPPDEDLVVTSNGKPVALLTTVDESTLDRELEIRRRTRAALLLERAYREAARHGAERLTDAEIQAEIAASRTRR